MTGSTHPADRAEYFEANGYLTDLTVLDPQRAAAVRADFDALEQREGRDHCQIGLQGRHLDQRFIWELATHPTILDAIEALMGPDILVLSTHVFCKYPLQTEQFVAWHQDVTYWGLDPPYALTAWYAIDDSDVENGCMRVIPGTHAQGVLAHGKASQPGNLLSINQEVETEIDPAQAVDLELAAGQISIHHGHLIHGSNPNHSQRRRAGLTIRYCPPHVKPVEANSLGKPWPAVLARGNDPFEHFGQWKLEFDPG